MKGSEKQIAWAEKIKAEAITKIEAALTKMERRRPEKAAALRIASEGWLSHQFSEDAKWWIDHVRYADASWLLMRIEYFADGNIREAFRVA